MSLDAVRPEKIQKRFKALFYGGPGLGKTLTSIKFPRPYVFDTEGGCENEEYVDILSKEEGSVLKTLDTHQILSNIQSLRTQKHPFKTVVLDSISYLYQALLEEADSNPSIKEGFGGYYRYANKFIKKIILNLLKLDMNVIIICHSKDKYKVNSREMEIEERVPDGPKDLSHMFDLVLEICMNDRKSFKSVALVKKSRIRNFIEGDVINFNFQEISEKYGAETFIKDAVPVKMATDQQVQTLQKMIEILRIPFETTHKWLKKAQVENFREMESGKIQKCIDHLKPKMEVVSVSEEEDIKISANQ